MNIELTESSNRTFMELKLLIAMELTPSITKVLIVPLWN